MIRPVRALATVALAVTLAATATACGSDKTEPATKSVDKITYVTAFGAAGRDAFAWVAQEKGFFRDAGLDVTIQLGAATGENLKILSAGQAQFANVDLIGAYILAGKGTYTDFRTIAAVHQQTLVSIISLEGGGISSPKDLEGKTLGAATNSVNQLLFPAYAKLAGVDPNKVSWINVAPPQVPALLASGKVDALSTFLIGRAGIEKAAGKKASIMPYSDYLSDLYGNGLVTSASLAEQKPELVTRFRDAMLQALKYTIEHPEEAAAILHKAQPATAEAAALGEIKAMTPYVTAGGAGAPIGALDEQRVARAIAILSGAGLIPSGLTPDAVVDFDLTPKV